MRATLLFLPLLLAVPARGQGLDARVAAAPDGPVRMWFSPGPGVCGDGGELVGRRDGAGRLSTFWGSLEQALRHDGDRACVPGPVRVELAVRGGRVAAVHTRVGGAEPRGRGTDLGRVAPGEAAGFLLRLAEESGGDVGEGALRAAVLGDVDTLWRGLVRLARGARGPEVRRHASHELGWWASQTVHGSHGAGAGHAVDLKKNVPPPRVPAWIRVARADPDPDRRRDAFRLLGKSGDPAAVDFLAAYLERATTPP